MSLGSATALRRAKAALVGAVGFYFTLVALGNLTDYGTNLAFVEHVLRMDTVFPDSRLTWRAITSPALHHLFYAGIIAWETATAVLVWTGAWRLWRTARGGGGWAPACRFASVALAIGLALWLVAFITVGSEWFAMWQSKTWNGQAAAARSFAVQALVLLFLLSPEPAD
jgi:predicted small integral membrane protein